MVVGVEHRAAMPAAHLAFAQRELRRRDAKHGSAAGATREFLFGHRQENAGVHSSALRGARPRAAPSPRRGRHGAMSNQGRRRLITSSACGTRIPASAMHPPSSRPRRQAPARGSAADWRECWRRRYRSAPRAAHRRARTSRRTPLARALSMPACTACGVDVDADDAAARRASRRRSRGCRSRSRSRAPTCRCRNRARAARRGTGASSDASRCRTRDPGSSVRLMRVAIAAAVHHDGTIQRSSAMRIGANCACVARTQSWSATIDASYGGAARAMRSRRIAQHRGGIGVRRRAARSAAKSATIAASALAGSSNTAVSSGVPRARIASVDR